MTRFAVIAQEATTTNLRLLEAARSLAAEAVLLSPSEARRRLRAGDLALARLDVLPTLAGPQAGVDDLRVLHRRGVAVLNGPGALLGAHDKLATAIRLGARGLPHPRTVHVGRFAEPGFGYPVVVKPRFGSWGRDVHLCAGPDELRRRLGSLARRAWFVRHGALVQELVRPQGHDLRLVVASGEIVGAIRRIAALGEWRTNVALGGTRRGVDPPPEACVLALRAADAIGADLVGVDLLPDGNGGWTVLELNGAVDFTEAYSFGGEDVYERAIRALLRSSTRNRPLGGVDIARELAA
jgi:RimK family alpha-L-glutamate ligase